MLDTRYPILDTQGSMLIRSKHLSQTATTAGNEAVPRNEYIHVIAG